MNTISTYASVSLIRSHVPIHDQVRVEVGEAVPGMQTGWVYFCSSETSLSYGRDLECEATEGLRVGVEARRAVALRAGEHANGVALHRSRLQ